MNYRTILAMLLTAAGTALAVPAAAQDAPEGPQIAAEDVTTGQVVSFVNAMISVDRIRREYVPMIEAAETDDARQELISEADEKSIALVEQTPGISPAEYIAIIAAATEDEDLMQRINDRLAELRAKQSGSRIAPQSETPAPDAATDAPAEQQ
ncbi:DUF4168 domain-containing protein [Roseovarius amoyensis]|uniref:DUF4168 domain-containing protein n=1 Tax=Roseovarius amoyensis TaxID=2211448 RepID=UPI000DBE27ED|nr:DUF4168 domain-containing protein [Roseovarius amoyensis]